MHPQLNEYIDLLKKHDWTFNYSDDHRAYTKGNLERKVLTDMAKVIDPEYKVWNEHCPEIFQAKMRLPKNFQAKK